MKHITPSLATLFILSIGCKKDPLLPPAAVNRPIAISAGVPQNVYTNKVKDFRLDATATVSSNGKRTLYFLWTNTTYPPGQPAVIVDPSKASTLVEKLTAGSYQFNLKVWDAAGNQASENFQVAVLQDSVQSAPKINAIGDMEVQLPSSTILLDGIENYRLNPAGRDLFFLWTLISSPANSNAVLSNATSEKAGIDIVTPGRYTFSLKLTNEIGLSSIDTFNIVALSDPLSGTEKIYDSVAWFVVQDDDWGPYAYLFINDPILTQNRNAGNTSIEIWDDDKKQWLPPTGFDYYFDNGLYLFTYENLQLLQGKKARVRLKFL